MYKSVLAAVGPAQGEERMEDKGVQQPAAPWVSRGANQPFCGRGERSGFIISFNLMLGKPKRRRRRGRVQNGCPTVFKRVSGEEQGVGEPADEA